METATAAVGSVLTRLRAYLNNHKEDHCGDVEQLAQELERIHAALFCSASAHERAPPPGQQVHEEPTGACVGEARELAYDTDDAVDAFLLVTSSPPPVRQDSVGHTIEGLLQRATDLYRRIRPQVPGVSTGGAVAHPRKQQQQHQVAPQPDGDEAATVVGVDDARDRLIRRLRPRGEAGDDEADGKVKVVSVVGSPGLGKTTLAGEAYGAIRPRFDCAAFVSVGISPDVPQILEAALQQLGGVAEGADAAREPRDEGPLLIVSQLREFLQNKRYFIVFDDLWDTSTWEKIRGALPDNNLGSRILTTTRNLDVADEIGATYELKPLSPEHSKKLFFRTAFGREEDKCPDDEHTEVADKILEKCGGVPLAILTVGRLLASKAGDKGEWRRVCESMGSRPLENTSDVNNMRTAVFPGYYNLPPHLRACLLYTSIFPENFEIRRDRLIRRWIAEGSVQLQPGDERVESLYELGQSYFEELVNRSMIQFLDIDLSDDGFRDEYCCSVSFPVMDFIRYLSSSQENFVAVLDGRQQCEFPTDMPVRRVCVRGQGGSKAEEKDSVSLGTSMSKLRSLTVFSPATPGSVDLTNMSEFLRVLDLEGCDLSESRLLQDHLGRLVHLRYLGLRDTRIAAVPEEIGDLKFLQTLNLEGNSKIGRLPESVARLGELACLRVSFQTLLPRGIGNMTALEELADATTSDSPGLVEALAGLTRLRVLRITLWQPAPREEEALVESLRCLRELQTLDVYLASGFEKRDDAARGDEDWWAPPPLPTRCLREFRAGAATSATLLSRARLLPSWLGATAVPPRLAVVVVHLRELRQSDVDALGRLPALRLLRLEPYDTAEALHVSGGGAFPRLEECRFHNGDVVPVFRPGAMPRLTRLEVCFRVRKTVDLGNAAFEFGFENLACLEEVVVYVGCQEAWETETDAAEAAFRRAADGHPNRAAFEVITFGEELMCFDDDIN